jgi:hypothetical protein
MASRFIYPLQRIYLGTVAASTFAGGVSGAYLGIQGSREKYDSIPVAVVSVAGCAAAGCVLGAGAGVVAPVVLVALPVAYIAGAPQRK